MAAVLADRDPGARVDGNTIVVSGNGDHVFGVPHRPNFIIALGSDERIVGGEGNDELGALGNHDTIVAGRGNDLIHGGPDATLVGGSGHDELIDAHADATVMVESSGDEVMVSGHDDRVLCSRRARDDVIYEGKSDSIGATCRTDHERVLPGKSFTTVRSVARAVAVVSGPGTEDPYVASCDNPSVILADCTVSSFPARTLSGLWANEYVPAYKMPQRSPLAARPELRAVRNLAAARRRGHRAGADRSVDRRRVQLPY